MNKTALAIVCWNRPDYFSKLITSLESNLDDLSDVDIHLFVDGDICAFTGERMTDKEPIYKNISIFQNALLPNKFLYTRTLNVSVAIHQFQMMQMLTPIYERIIFLEDDVVVSPNFVVLMLKALDQFNNDDRIFSVSPGFKLMCKPGEEELYRDALRFTEGHFWAEAIWSKRWRVILPRLQEYMDIVSTRAYRQRDNQKINALFSRYGRTMSATSQDNAKDWAISVSGLKRARFMVNRATGIGEEGLHSTKEKLRKSGDGFNKIQVFDDDKKLKFRII